MNRFLYSLLLYLITPLILLRLLYRSIKNPEYRRRIPERFGFYSSAPRPGGIWVHAVSVGEAIAAITLIKAVQEQYPEHAITVTCGTPTGSGVIQKQLGSSVYHVYAPYDLPGSVNRFLRKVRPATGIIMETEIWPNLLHQASDRGINLMISNMRLSETSFRRYQKFPGLIASSLACIGQVAAQTDQDSARAIALGAQADRVQVVGNLKFELADSEAFELENVERLKNRVAAGRNAWLAGSTHEGEDEIVLQVHGELLAGTQNLLLILVPRHPERFESVYLLSSKQFRTQKRSELADGETLKPDTQVLLVDTIGELSQFISICDWAFIGGSLVPVGGHNILEACQAGVPVLFGEHMFNFSQIASIVEQEHAGTRITDQAELLTTCKALARSSELRAEQGMHGRALVQSNRGALAKTMAMLEQFTGAD